MSLEINDDGRRSPVASRRFGYIAEYMTRQVFALYESVEEARQMVWMGIASIPFVCSARGKTLIGVADVAGLSNSSKALSN